MFTKERIAEFKKEWGQSELEICSELGYDPDNDGTTEELMADGYFWLEEDELWCNETASWFVGDDQQVADYLRHSR